MAEIVSQYRIEVKQAVDALNEVARATDAGAKKSEDLGKKTEQAGQKANKAAINFTNLGKQILSAFGLTAGVVTFVNALKNAVMITANFEAQMSKVRAVSGATADQMSKLEKSAKQLGATTRFTATQVGQLQEEYARLGFTTAEILAATEATLSLAAATGSTLADAAQVAGATVRGFGLDASETGRVTDVMALSFSRSALSMSDFAEAMKLVAPIARAANIPIETTTALLGKLADSGLRGSIAGTALKNLLSQLSNENSDLAKEIGFGVKNSEDLFRAFDELAKKNIDLTAATELTDERSKAAFITLINGSDAARELSGSLDGAAGSAKAMADIMTDNLKGAVTELGSAWEGFILSVTKTGVLEDGTRSLTAAIQALTDSITGRNAPFEKARQEVESFKESLLGLTGVGILREIEKQRDALADNENALIELRKSRSAFATGEDFIKAIRAQELAVDTQREKFEAARKALDDFRARQQELGGDIAPTVDEINNLNAALSETGGSGGTTESAVRSIATLSEELKTLKEQFENAAIGSEGYFKAASAIEAKTKELARALLDARMSLIDIEQPVQMAVKAVDKLAGDSLKSLAAQLAEAKKRKEEAFEFTPEFNQAIKDIDRLEQRIKDFGQTTIEVGAEVKSTVTEDVAASTAQMQQAQQNAFDVMQAGLSTLGNIYGSIAQMAEQTTRYELQLLRDRFEDGEITREEYYAKEKQLQRESAQRAKDAATFQAILGAAQAALNALSTPGVPFPIALAFSLFAAAQAAVQVAAIQSAPIPRFEQGGAIKGKRHYQGGEFIEAEAGEYVVNRKATAKNYELIEAINKGMGEAYIMRNWVAPAVDAALLNGWQDVGKSAELNGLTATLKDHNIIRAMDRNREATTYGLTMVAGELKRLKSDNSRKAW
jgi:TP901 family phage tail tape measure protein